MRVRVRCLKGRTPCAVLSSASIVGPIAMQELHKGHHRAPARTSSVCTRGTRDCIWGLWAWWGMAFNVCRALGSGLEFILSVPIRGTKNALGVDSLPSSRLVKTPRKWAGLGFKEQFKDRGEPPRTQEKSGSQITVGFGLDVV